MKFAYLWDRFKYCLKRFARPKRKFEIKPRSTFFIDGAAQSHVDAVTVSTNCLPSSHSTAPPLPSDVEDHAHTPVHPSHSPNLTSLNFCTDLVVSPSSSHMHSFFRLVFVLRCSSGWCYLVFVHSRLFTCCEQGTTHWWSWCCTTNMFCHSWRVWVGALTSTLGEGWLPSIRAPSILSWHIWWACHPWFCMCVFIRECTHCWSLAGLNGC